MGQAVSLLHTVFTTKCVFASYIICAKHRSVEKPLTILRIRDIINKLSERGEYKTTERFESMLREKGHSKKG